MSDPRLKRLLWLSMAAAITTLLLKSASYYLTGSVGLLSDAVESLVNLLAAVTAYFSLWFAALPVDRTHTYGHEKIEYFSSGLEGVLILVAAAGIGWYAVHRLIDPAPLQALDVGVLLTAVAAVINLGVARVLVRVGRGQRSIVLEADGRHLMADFWTSTGVVVGLGLIWLVEQLWQLRWHWIDPVIALAVAGNITWTGYGLVKRSFHGLMDHALPEAEQAIVRGAIEAQLGAEMDYHALRTRQAGSRRFADCHLLVPGGYSVQRAHEVANRIEQAVRIALPDMEVTVHIEPIEEKAAYEDSALVRLEQNEKRTGGGTGGMLSRPDSD
jgi:cation diffusion facilitator family transporter